MLSCQSRSTRLPLLLLRRFATQLADTALLCALRLLRRRARARITDDALNGIVRVHIVLIRHRLHLCRLHLRRLHLRRLHLRRLHVCRLHVCRRHSSCQLGVNAAGRNLELGSGIHNSECLGSRC